jgi:hypothetical protein
MLLLFLLICHCSCWMGSPSFVTICVDHAANMAATTTTEVVAADDTLVINDVPVFTRTPSLGSRFRRAPSTDKIDGTGAIVSSAAPPSPTTSSTSSSIGAPPLVRSVSEIKREETARDLLVRLDTVDDYDKDNLLSTNIVGITYYLFIDAHETLQQ